MAIVYGRQGIAPADIDAVVDLLRAGTLVQGLMALRFESRIFA